MVRAPFVNAVLLVKLLRIARDAAHYAHKDVTPYTDALERQIARVKEKYLREDGTCEVVCDLDLLGTIRRETDYRVVQNLSDLPTDLVQQVMFGRTPTVSVVYDAEKDVLYTCLEEGMYVYLTREGSGEMGGLYEP